MRLLQLIATHTDPLPLLFYIKVYPGLYSILLIFYVNFLIYFTLTVEMCNAQPMKKFIMIRFFSISVYLGVGLCCVLNDCGVVLLTDAVWLWCIA